MANMQILFSILVFLVLTACGPSGGSSTSSEQASDIPDAVISNYQFTTEAGRQVYDVATLHVQDKDMMGVSLNDSGVLAGNYLDGPGHSMGFVWSDDQIKVVIPEGQVAKINESNMVTGWEDAAGCSVACIYDKTLVYLQEGKAYGINDNGVVAGLWQQSSETKPFIDDGQTSSVPISEFEGYGVLINNSGTVVLHELLEDSVVPHLYENDQLTSLPTMGGTILMPGISIHLEMWSDGLKIQFPGIARYSGKMVFCTTLRRQTKIIAPLLG